MARTKAEQRNLERGKRANELAAVAQCVEAFVRDENTKLSQLLQIFKQENYEQLLQIQQYEIAISRAIDRIRRRDRRIEELELNFEDMAQTLHDALNDLEQQRVVNNRLTEQVLDCTCSMELDTEVEDLTSQ